MERVRRSSLIGMLFIMSSMPAIFAQGTKYMTSSGQVSFFSETPAENISAVHKQVQVVLAVPSGEVAVRMKMTGFVFPNKLMQEHFNENYMESERYPLGTFTGKIDQQPDYTKDGVYEVTATGTLTVHGVAQPRKLSGKMTISKGSIRLDSQFDVALKAHNIEVPTLVFMKIAQVIQVKASFTLNPK